MTQLPPHEIPDGGPHEHVLQLTKDELLALPATIESFNGFYTTNGKFVMMNSIRVLIAEAIGLGILVVLFVWLVVRYVRRRKMKRRLQSSEV